MAKIKINKLPDGYELVDGKIKEAKSMRDGGMTTGDQADYGLVTTPQEFYGSTNFNNSRDENVRYSLSSVPRENANVEAEGGETVLTDLNNDGQFGLYNINGPRHSKGGVPMFLPEQSFIFSDTPKLKFGKEEMSELDMMGDKKTPAKISKKFDLNTYYAELGSQYADNISSLSAELMLKKNMNDLSKLAFMQESKKGFEDGVPLAAHPYLISVGEDPIQFTAKIEEISEKQAEKDIINSLPLDQQQQIMMLQEFMAQAQQQQEGNPQGNVGPNEQMAIQAEPGSFNAMEAAYGTEIKSYQNGTEVDLQEGDDTADGTFKNPYKGIPGQEENEAMLEEYRAKGYELSIVDGKIRAYLPYQSKFKDQGKVVVQDIEGIGTGETTVISEDNQEIGSVIESSPIGEYRPGIYSGGNRPEKQGVIYDNQIVDGVYDPTITADKSTDIYAYGSAKIKSAEGRDDFMKRWGNDIADPNSPMYIEGFDFGAAANDPQWKEFQVLAEQTREAEAKELGIPYVPHFKNKGDEGYVAGQGFDGALGMHTFNTPRIDIDFTSSDEQFMELPVEQEDPKVDIKEQLPADAKWWQQDENNLNSLMGIEDDLFLPFAPTLEDQNIDYVLDDYTGRVNANNASASTLGKALSSYGPKALERSGLMGKAFDANAKAINQVNSNNVKTMNRVATMQPQLDMQVDVRNAIKDTKLYDDTNLTLQNAQNFSNWKTAKANELYNAGITNAANTANMNDLYNYYDINPQAAGRVEFGPGGRELYRDSSKSQIDDFKDFYVDLQKEFPDKDLDLNDTFTNWSKLRNGNQQQTDQTKAMNEFENNILDDGYKGNNVQITRSKGGAMKKLPNAFPFSVGRMGR